MLDEPKGPAFCQQDLVKALRKPQAEPDAGDFSPPPLDQLAVAEILPSILPPVHAGCGLARN